jgi:phosphoribosylformylglycinamidine synthase
MAGGALVGIQDMGAAGLTSSSVEMAGRAGSGLELDLDRVPRRESGMTPYELMLSESQERMLLVAHEGREGEVRAICDKWDIDCAVVGRVTDSGRIVVLSEKREVASIPIAPLTEGLKYERPMQRPAWQDELQKLDESALAQPADLGAALLAVLADPDVASKRWVWRQYDHMVGDNTVVRPGSDAAVIRIRSGKGKDKGVAVTSGCNARYCYLDPYEGARLAVAEAFRNLCATGAEPIAVTDCLNFGNPERPEIMWQFAECVRGIGDACRALETPVVSGNVSLYNETEGRAIHPTPMIGMVGRLERVEQAVTQWFKKEGHVVMLVGDTSSTLGGTTYLRRIHGKVAGKLPEPNLERELEHGRFLQALAREGLLASAHDCSDGGLAVALAECCLGEQPLGAQVALMADGEATKIRADGALFSESPGRYVISFAPEHQERVKTLAHDQRLAVTSLGTVGGRRLEIEVNGKKAIDLGLDELQRAHGEGFEATVVR